MGVRRRRAAWCSAVLVAAPLSLAMAVACAARAVGSGRPLPVVQVPAGEIRVALVAERGIARITSGVGWRLTDVAGHDVVRPRGRDGWGVERRGTRLRAIHADGYESPWVDSILVLVPDVAGALSEVQGKRYRGGVSYVATDSATLIVNALPVETYLRGVVPLEIGARPASDVAAVEAQTVVARSFAFERMRARVRWPYDLTALDLDQVYGGAAAETAQGNAAVDATRDLVLSYNGRVIGAPYHSACGGNTASASDVWKTADTPYLQSVSDGVAGTDRAYCDLSPRFRWERSFTAVALKELVERYLRRDATLPSRPTGAVRDVQVAAHTPSGRAAVLTVVTESGTHRLSGNDIRFVLRGVGGDLLPSTYFSLEPVIGRDGRLTQLAVHGRGNGHGVGLCQWGAIGRARAGHDVRAILRAYFPAAELARGT